MILPPCSTLEVLEAALRHQCAVAEPVRPSACPDLARLLGDRGARLDTVLDRYVEERRDR